jgi:hypothetical protein
MLQRRGLRYRILTIEEVRRDALPTLSRRYETERFVATGDQVPGFTKENVDDLSKRWTGWLQGQSN